MKHEKEWYTCDRCGKEIDKFPSQKHILRRKIASPTELKMMCDEKYGYVGDNGIIIECEYEKMKLDKNGYPIVKDNELVKEKHIVRI